MVTSFKTKQKNRTTISKLRINNTELTQTSDIRNAFNKYFNTVGQELVDNLINTNNNLAQYVY